MCEKGWGVTQDYAQALSWYRKAAAQGSSHAEWNLGRLYQEGLGVPPDLAAAIEHYRRAARAGHSASQEKLRQLGQTW
jgi:TPR repeat protein